MCGRFNIVDDRFTHTLLDSLGISLHLKTQFNIAPTEYIPVVIQQNDTRHVNNMRWWLTPSWAKEPTTRYAMFNAKSETIRQSKAFHQAFHHRRGVVPMHSFIEWQTSSSGPKTPYCIRPVEHAVAFAAIWECWEQHEHYLESCAILTTAATADFTHIHARMPVLLDADECQLWLNPNTDEDTLDELMQPRLTTSLEYFPLATAINNSRNKDDRCIQAVGGTIQLLAAN